MQPIIQQMETDPSASKFTWKCGLLHKNGKLVVGRYEELRQETIKTFHASAIAGHSGVHGTTKRISNFCFWKGLERDVRMFIRSCDVCQRSKYDNSASPGLIQSLTIPTVVWSEISLDFIEGLPNSSGKEVIMVVVDRLTKYAHFVALRHPFSAFTVAYAFLSNIFKLHGLPMVIVSDRDAVFLSQFWLLSSSYKGLLYISQQLTIHKPMGKRRSLIGVWRLTCVA